MLIDASVIYADANAYALPRRIEALLGNRFPSSFQNIAPFDVVFCERKLVFDLKVELGIATLTADAFDDEIIERIVE